jgi:hypothetical protein
MARAITVGDGLGQVLVYTLSASERLTIDTCTFTLITDGTAGSHSPEILLADQAGNLIARIPDWNDAAANGTYTYTFGRGLTPFCGIVNSGGSVQNDLPFTLLEPGGTIALQSVDGTGSVVAGDALTMIVLWVEDLGSVAGGPIPAPQLLPVLGGAAV